MQSRPKVIALVTITTIFGFLTESHSPLGGFWPPAADMPNPAGMQMVLFALLGLIEAIALGVGLALLIFGKPLVAAAGSRRLRFTRSAHLAISWLLMNWWAHDSLHQHVGMNLTGLLYIEYGFHASLIVCGIVLMRFFLGVVRTPLANTPPERGLTFSAATNEMQQGLRS